MSKLNNGYGAQALDINQLIDLNDGTGIVSGCTASVGTNAMEVDVASGTARISDTNYSITASTILLDSANADYPRKDLVVVDSTGSMTKITGAAETAKPAGSTRRDTYQPKPADVSGTDVAVVAEVWVGAGASDIVSGDISDRRLFSQLNGFEDTTGDGVAELHDSHADFQGGDARDIGALDAGVAAIGDPHAAPTGQSQAEGHIQKPVLSVSNKQKLLGTGDVGWTTADLAWPGVIKAGEIFTDPLGEWYMYYAEDHTSDAAIGLAYADDPAGPYTDYGSNPVFGGGTTTSQETPQPVWNPETGELYLYYHNPTDGSGTHQTTAYATSTDGIAFTEQGIAIDVPPNTPGNGHTGYAHVQRFGGDWIAYHLMGGSDWARFGMSYSRDGQNWTTDPRPLVNNADITGDNARRIEWNMSTILMFNGHPWWFGATSPYQAGSAYTGKKLAAAPLLNARRLAREPEVIADVTEAWESGGLVYPNYVVDNSTVHAFYTSGGSLGMAELDGGAF